MRSAKVISFTPEVLMAKLRTPEQYGEGFTLKARGCSSTH